MDTTQLIQGTAEWRQARCGSLGASRVHDALAKTKSDWGASRANIMAELIAERLTGIPAEGYVNAAMQWGTDTEPHARAMFEFMHDVTVEMVGIILHPSIPLTHASPDGLINADGLIEIKCPSTATHIDTLLNKSIPAKYITQMQWQMACTGRSYCYFVSFDPRMPADMQLYVERTERDNNAITHLETEVRRFLAEASIKIQELKARYSMKEVA